MGIGRLYVTLSMDPVPVSRQSILLEVVGKTPTNAQKKDQNIPLKSVGQSLSHKNIEEVVREMEESVTTIEDRDHIYQSIDSHAGILASRITSNAINYIDSVVSNPLFSMQTSDSEISSDDESSDADVTPDEDAELSTVHQDPLVMYGDFLACKVLASAPYEDPPPSVHLVVPNIFISPCSSALSENGYASDRSTDSGSRSDEPNARHVS